MIHKVSDEKDSLTDIEISDHQPQAKACIDLTIQRPLQFVTKDSNFSPMKKPTSENTIASRFKKENQHKPELKNSPKVSKNSFSSNLKLL